MRQCGLRILQRVQGQRRLVLGKAMAVGEVRILLLQESAVRQKNSAQFLGRVRAEDSASKAVPYEGRQVARVVEVGMGQENRVDGLRFDREWRPVSQSELFHTL